jgi:two-component system CheB/CheR fusion protein
LETRVTERTRKLRAALVSLETEFAERQRLEREILEIAERERSRVGQDLHDGLCQTLTGIALIAKLLQQSLEEEKLSPAAASADAKTIVTLVRDANAEARGLALEMYPVNIEEYGLAHALKKLANDMALRMRIKCNFKSTGSLSLADKLVATHLYRITQEAVSNAFRHGRAELVAITLAASDNRITLKIADNGHGQLKKLKPTGMGLKTMNYRARAIGGSLEIRQRPRGGLAVICSIPNR